MKSIYAFLVAGLTATMIALGGCGGGSGGGGTTAGIGGTGKIASGTIVGFGSIILDDGTYDIDSASCDVDDDDTSGLLNCNLAEGMVVTVIADDFDDATRTGTATHVLFDDDVDGPVTDLIDDGSTKSFTVLGTAVVVDAAATVFDDSFPGFSFDTIDNDDIVEASGFFDANGDLHASYIEKKGILNPGVTEVELKGIAVGNAGPGDSFTINGVTVNILANADLGDVPGGMVTNGMFVEAKGIIQANGEIDASKVEEEDDIIGENEDEVSIEGLVSNYVSDSNFRVAGFPVNAGSASFEPASLVLMNGLEVEVEGPVVNGILVADEVEAEGGEIEINASVSDTLNNTITLELGSAPGNLTVTVDADTDFEDDNGGDLSVSDINLGDFLEVRGFDDGAGNIIATEIRRSSDTDNDVILQGPLDDFDPLGGSITVLGIQFSVNGSTSYEDEDDDPLADAAAFDALVSDGDMVKIKDEDPGAGAPNGTADEVDLED